MSFQLNKTVDRTKQVSETGRHFAANLVAVFLAILSHCLFIFRNRLHGPSPGLQIQLSGLSRFSLAPVLHIWVIWFLMPSVIFFTLSASFAAWCPRGAWCHRDPSVSLPLSALTLLSELEELARIYPWLLAAD